jgi:hypothetical protein
MAYTTVHGKLIKVGKSRLTNSAAIFNHRFESAKNAELKGKRDGNCNVSACQKHGATWFNTAMRAYYCEDCADDINYWSNHDSGHDICYPSEAAAIAAEFEAIEQALKTAMPPK